MRRYFVGGNWKCNNTIAQTQSLINTVINRLVFDVAKVEVAVAPIFLHVPWVQANIQKNVQVAVQNTSLTKMGAYTGEISVEQVKDFGIPWVILGHSERRQYYGETNEIVGKKTRLALDHQLKVMACVGEKLADRESGQTTQVIQAQLDSIKKELTTEQWANVVVAYEPVWAIGTGRTASPEQAQDVHAFIRGWLKSQIGAQAEQQTRIIYGGSVTEKNALDLIKQKDLDGFLVGGAALKSAFTDIVAAAHSSR
ncbi:unnamed protein product [Paramecium pentaurelia]|uniref:Triosephosphate isomerase n=1 Tax=Paramecium pentaurelia TaxID=43138 RepID=A0A8S1XZZ6_9CILI|nr:unnamed protein product [Paramecium pentaurelia]